MKTVSRVYWMIVGRIYEAGLLVRLNWQSSSWHDPCHWMNVRILGVLIYVIGVLCCCPSVAENINAPVVPKLAMREHVRDFQELFGENKCTKEIFERVSRYMDSEAFEDFKNLFPEAKYGLGKGEHRIMGHVLDGGYIRKAQIETIVKKTGLPKEVVLQRLVEYNKSAFKKLAAEVINIGEKHGLTLPARKVKALIRIAGCIHVLGDSSTAWVEDIPTLKRVVGCFGRNLHVFLNKEDEQYVLRLTEQMRRLLVGNNGKDRKAIYQLLKNTVVDVRVSERVQHVLQALQKRVAKGNINSIPATVRADLTAKMPLEVMKRVGSSKVANSMARWVEKSAIKVIGKSSARCLVKIKPALRFVPWVVDVGIWGFDMYSVYEEYKIGEISSFERNKEMTRTTGKAVGGLAGFKAGWKAAEEATKYIDMPDKYELPAKIIAGIVGALGGEYAGGKVAEVGYDKVLGNPFEQCQKAADNNEAEAMFFMGKYYDEGRHVKRNFSESVSWWKRAAGEHHERALYQLGECYLLGKGTGVNRIKALACEREALSKGYMLAALPLSKMYYEGIGTVKSSATSAMFIKTALESNVKGAKEYAEELVALNYQAANTFTEGDDPSPFRHLAEFFAAGVIVEQSDEVSRNYYELAAECGDTLAICKLGDFSMKQKDYEAALYYYQMAVDDDCPEALIKLAYLEANFLHGDSDMTEWLLFTACHMDWCLGFNEMLSDGSYIVKWLSGEADRGDDFANIILGRMNLGYMLPPDASRAFARFEGSADRGSLIGLSRLGRAHLFGWGVERNIEEAEKILKTAASMGDQGSKVWLASIFKRKRNDALMVRYLEDYLKNRPVGSNCFVTDYAKFLLGDFLLSGNGKDIVRGVELLTQAADGGNELAQYELGCRYMFGQKVARNENLGIGYWLLATDANMSAAAWQLGMLYEFGNAVEKDIEVAKSYYLRASELGHPCSQFAYASLIVQEDKKTALKWMQIAAESRYTVACQVLGDIYFRTGDYEQAFRFYSVGAEEKCYYCMAKKGYCLYNGNGCVRDTNEAERCYELARQWRTVQQSKRWREAVVELHMTDEEELIVYLFKSLKSKSISVKPDFSDEKLELMKTALRVRCKEKVLVKYEDASFGRAGEGFILTEKGIYFSCGFGFPVFCSWKNFQNAEVQKGFQIHVHGKCEHLSSEGQGEEYFKSFDGRGDLMFQQALVDRLNFIAQTVKAPKKESPQEQ